MKFKKILLTVLLVIIAVLVLVNSETVRLSVAKAIDTCLFSLVPSLMTFMTVAGFISNSACCDVLDRIFGRIVRLVFNLPENCTRVVLLGALGGYPCGARLIGDMLDKNEIDTATAQRMLRFCINASPAYVISAIGVGLFGSARIGFVIFLSHILTAWLIGALFRGKKTPKTNTAKPQRLPLSETFVKSVLDSTNSMISISGFAITFSTILALLDVTGITQAFITLTKPLTNNPDISRTVLYELFDVVTGTQASLQCPPMPALLLCSGAVSFGGFSIIAQTAFCLSGHKLNFFEVFLFRLLHSVLTGAATYIIINISDTTVTTAYLLGTNPQQTQTGFVSTALFLICCVFFTVTVDKKISLLLQRRKRQ